MQIEIAKYARMCQTGQSLFSLIQNKGTPVLDLLVRESIQNSLDAVDKKAERNVSVSFITGNFCSSELCVHFEKIEKALSESHPSIQRFIAVRDENTVGLTGPLSERFLKKGDAHGNLLKLVYEISNAQTEAGAGGSWGLGKTVYFRIGIGLVVYYSRIKTENGYESRLAATMVEDESSEKAMIPNPAEGLGRGIAWWGRNFNGENLPILQDSEIEKVLKVFGIPAYTGEKTGTTIIIPYIDEKALLSNNICAEEVNRGDLFYTESVEEYLKNSIYRWYFPRLNNEDFLGKRLCAFINDKPVLIEEAPSFYRVFQQLYKIACAKSVSKEQIKQMGEEVFVEEVKTKSGLASQCSGCIAYLKASRTLLGMDIPNRELSPTKLLNLEQDSSGLNKPIVAFVRKPGMVVAYETIGEWVNKIPLTPPDKYIMAIFVLNSANKIKKNGIMLEEYVRKSELADHTSWQDYSVENEKFRIIAAIQNGVSRIVSNKFLDVKETSVDTKKSAFALRLGDLFLPPLGFGRRPGDDSGSDPDDPPKQGKSNGISLEIDSSHIKYLKNQMILNMRVIASKPHNGACIELFVDTENKCISASDWELDLGLDMPFSIESVTVNSVKPYGKKGAHMECSDIKANIERTKKKCGNKIVLEFEKKSEFDMVIEATIRICDLNRDKKPLFALGKMEKE